MIALAVMWLSMGCRPQAKSPDSPSPNIHTQPATPSDREPPSRIRFRDVTEQTGLEWTYRNGSEANLFSIVESMGGGLALCDFDQDGRLDVVAAGGGEFPAARNIRGLPTGLLRQLPTGTFENISDRASLQENRHFSHGVAAGDYDQDGFPDLAITGYGGISIYRNRGDGTFVNVSEGHTEYDHGWSTSAGWADVNGDRHPDLFVVHYADWSFENDPACPGPPPHGRDVCPPRKFHGLPDQLFLSDGQGGFQEQGQSSGLTSQWKSIGMAIADLDLDGDLDLYVTNDTDPNDFYQNNGTGKFEELGLEAGLALGADGNSDGSMGVDIGDFDGDGRPDVWVTNFEREVFALYQNTGNGQFQHYSRQSGINRISGNYVGWGTVFLDADGDGDQDIFATNGHVIRFPESSPVEQLPLMLENLSGKQFRNVAEMTGEYFQRPHAGRAVSVGDVDGDGDPDLVVAAVNQPLVLLANESEWQGLTMRLVGRQSPRQPIGAIVRVRAEQQTLVQQLTRAGGYASTAADTLFFGLGDRSADQIEVQWPSGLRQVIQPDPGRRQFTLIEPQ